MAFEFFKQKSIEDILRPSPESFLEEHPAALRKLKNALRRIKFNFKGNFVVDLTMPNWIGGYFNLVDTIAINPWLLLYGAEKDIAHVLFHEGLHAGVYTETGVDDEALVEAMTKKKMAEVYGGASFKSGYDDMVNDFNQYFGDMNFSELSEMIESGDEQTFDNLLEVMVVNPSLDDKNYESLDWEEIKRRLGRTWGVLQKLFPRMMNSIEGKNVGPHDGTNVSLHHFKLDSLLEKTAKRILGEQTGLINKIITDITKEGEENLDKELIKEEFFKLGLGYLYDTDPEFIEEQIEKFVEYHSAIKFVKNFDLSSIVSLSVSA
ncbi:hypothetical protein KC678_03360 [Candidatus Dojkabacteria bacterium]|uniref:Uncharacterized protein n=1 Tax=Candidatus Dojkabacteria bacterium TaxID=2099670 RepID=A0A955L1R1_9BACT|nr:hypothetical protein [Candidatus Dojkabacteria bacterium]